MNFSNYKASLKQLWNQPALFEPLALSLFKHQAKNVPPYAQWISTLNINPNSVETVNQIPFLPIRFFKSKKVLNKALNAQKIFNSSGTTGQNKSTHYLHSPDFYLENCQNIFESHYGPLGNYVLLAVLPNYKAQPNSSLIFMIDSFIKKTGHVLSGYYLNNAVLFKKAINEARTTGRKIMVWGVTYALTDLAGSQQIDLSNTLVIETGGMKGRKQELTRLALHQILKKGFNNPALGSEYGMAELCSQAYAGPDGLFKPPPIVRFLVRDITDPFAINAAGRGRLNIIDLANYGSCAFIETEDIIARQPQQAGYQILGRLDGSEQRGCSLLTA